MWTMNFQMFKLDLEKAVEPEIKLPTSVGSLKKQESSRKTSISVLLTMPKPLTGWITINWKILKEMGISDHLTCPMSNLYAGQEATVRTGHGTTDWFQIGKGVCQGCIYHLAYLTYMQSAAAAKSLQSCPTLCDPIDGSPPGSPIPRIFQARTLEWVAISFSNAWKGKVKVKSLSRVRLLATPWTAQVSNRYFHQYFISRLLLVTLLLNFYSIYSWGKVRVICLHGLLNQSKQMFSQGLERFPSVVYNSISYLNISKWIA